nr:hypothetical protein [Halomonas daqiaonensis]
MKLSVVPASSIEASIQNPELVVACPPPQHTTQNDASYPHGEQLILTPPKPGKGKHNPERYQQYGKADNAEFDQDLGHHCESNNPRPFTRKVPRGGTARFGETISANTTFRNSLLPGPLDLKFDLFFIVRALVFNAEFSTHRHIDSLALNLNIKTLSVLYGIGQTPQLGHKVGLRIPFFYITFWLIAHAFSARMV